MASAAVPSPVAAKSLIDYFTPTPLIGPLTSNAWGAPNVLPRDTSNGLEDAALKQWVYWDGKILRARDGKYHLFGSRWEQSGGHWAWFGSSAIHAVSDSSPLGPYVDKELAYTDQNGRGHNVSAAELPDGRYCILISETRPVGVYLSDSLDGPWTYGGDLHIDANGFSADGVGSNTGMTVGPDGSILMVSRHGILMRSTTGITGTYKVQGPTVYPNIPGMNFSNAEDPVIWYSGGQYHIIYNYWDAKVAYHLASADGIHWTNKGVAYDPTKPFIRYTDGTVNKWTKLERPGVLIEGGHVTHFTFAAIDVEKEQDVGNDNHGSKIIVVPFDGELFDTETGIGGEDAGRGDGGHGGSDGGVDGGASDGARPSDGGGHDGGRDRDASAVSDGAVAADAGQTPADAGAWGDGGEGEAVLGCSCGTAGNRSRSAGMPWLMLGLVAASVARRRRPSRRWAIRPTSPARFDMEA